MCSVTQNQNKFQLIIRRPQQRISVHRADTAKQLIYIGGICELRAMLDSKHVADMVMLRYNAQRLL